MCPVVTVVCPVVTVVCPVVTVVCPVVTVVVLTGESKCQNGAEVEPTDVDSINLAE